MRTALIVEPDVQSAKLLAVVLGKAGFETHTVNTGEDALKMLEGFKFHIIVTELELPVMSGLMLIDAIRASPTSRSTPVVVATSNHDPESKRRARTAGCSKFVTKPVDVTSLGSQIVDLLGVEP